MAWLILFIVAWGALAFGAIYDWARWALLAACVAAGVWGFVRQAPHERRRVPFAMLAGLLLVALAIGLQLVPIDREELRRWSPATHAFLKQYDLRYAMAAAGDGVEGPNLKHPLSIDPPKTRVGLACFAAFGFMLLGLARGIGGRDLRIVAPGIVTLGVLMSMIGIIQKALWSGNVYGFWEPVNKGAVAFGPFINRNHFAGWMLLALTLPRATSPRWRRRARRA
jgi:hypothetical protein